MENASNSSGVINPWNGRHDSDSARASGGRAVTTGGRQFPDVPMEIMMHRYNLPVREYRDRFLEAIRRNNVLIVMGETGSGKTTQLPQYLYEAGFGQCGVIGITLPRCALNYLLFV